MGWNGSRGMMYSIGVKDEGQWHTEPSDEGQWYRVPGLEMKDNDTEYRD